MRLPDIATSATNALSDGMAFASRMASPTYRRLARRYADARGSLELIAVLAGESGQITCRFLARFAGSEVPHLGFWWLSGRRAPLVARCVSRVASAGELSEAVLSVSVPERALGFFAGSPEVGMALVSRHDLCRLERRRDDMMVNPAIDERYRYALATGGGRAADGAGRGQDAPSAGRARGAGCAGEAVGGDASAHIGEPRPLMSVIVPLYRTPVKYFRAMVDSVLAQTYGNWELVLVNASPDDANLAQAVSELTGQGNPRIVVVELAENKGISENTLAGIAVASGDYLSFLDHDDLLEPDALAAYVTEIRAHPQVDLLYCDEDSVTHDGTTCFEARFKPDFNLDLLLTHNYVCHFLTVSREAYEQVEPYGHDVDGAQDYDLTLKVSEMARDIRHVPRVLYHWRQHAGSTNGGATAVKPYVVASSINALSRYLARRGIEAKVAPTDFPCVFDVAYPKSADADVSVIVATDADDELLGFLESLETQRMGSVCQLIEAAPADGLSAPSGDFARRVNAAAAQATGEYLLVADARIRFAPESDCIGALRDVFCRNEVGVASAKVMATDGHVLHAGLCVQDDGSLGYLNQGFTAHMGGGYHGLAECDCAYSAVAPFCFMVRASDFRDVGGLDDGYAAAVAQTIDLSFKMRERGKAVIVRPAALAFALMDPREADLGGSALASDSADGRRLWGAHGCAYQTDVLSNPHLEFSTGYPRLRTMCF